MSVRVSQISIATRVESGSYVEAIDRYETNGWTLSSEKDGQAMMMHAGMPGVAVLIVDQDREEMGQ